MKTKKANGIKMTGHRLVYKSVRSLACLEVVNYLCDRTLACLEVANFLMVELGRLFVFQILVCLFVNFSTIST